MAAPDLDLPSGERRRPGPEHHLLRPAPGIVDRVVMGAGSLQNGVAFGFAVRWRTGIWAARRRPQPASGAVVHRRSKGLLDFKDTTERHLAAR